MIGRLLQLIPQLLGGGAGGKGVVDVVETFRPSAEKSAQREADYRSAALAQYAAEFGRNRNFLDSAIDALNRLVRPAFAWGVIWMLVWTVVDPGLMARVFESWAVLPDFAWGVVSLVVGFYFAGRLQIKHQSAKAAAGHLDALELIREADAAKSRAELDAPVGPGRNPYDDMEVR